MSYRIERVAFHKALIALGWKPGDAYELTRRADTSQYFAVQRCNRELSEREERRDERNDRVIRAIASRNGCRADVSGDPRGAVVKLQWEHSPQVPAGFPVRELADDEHPTGRTTCGTCGRSWDDDVITGLTPTPSGRCPFEYYHQGDRYRPEGLGAFASFGDANDVCVPVPEY